MSRGTATTRVSPPTYLRWPSAGLGRILPPWLHKNLTLFFGDDDDDEQSSLAAPSASPAINWVCLFFLKLMINNRRLDGWKEFPFLAILVIPLVLSAQFWILYEPSKNVMESTRGYLHSEFSMCTQQHASTPPLILAFSVGFSSKLLSLSS